MPETCIWGIITTILPHQLLVPPSPRHTTTLSHSTYPISISSTSQASGSVPDGLALISPLPNPKASSWLRSIFSAVHRAGSTLSNCLVQKQLIGRFTSYNHRSSSDTTNGKAWHKNRRAWRRAFSSSLYENTRWNGEIPHGGCRMKTPVGR